MPFSKLFPKLSQNSKALTESLEAIDVLREKIQKLLQHQKAFSIDGLLEQYSPLCDDTIILTIKENPELTYVAGQFILSLSEQKDDVHLEVKFYFQDPEGKWVQKMNTNVMKFAQFDADSREKIAIEKILKFEIETPEQL